MIGTACGIYKSDSCMVFFSYLKKDRIFLRRFKLSFKPGKLACFTYSLRLKLR